MATEHGTSKQYKYYKCRCSKCTNAYTKEQAEYKKRRLEWLVEKGGKLVSTHPKITHGLFSTYKNWGCRCPKCANAHRMYNRKQRYARKLK